MSRARPAARCTPSGTGERRPSRRLLVPPRTLAPPPCGDTKAEQRPLRRRACAGQVGWLRAALLERSLRFAASLLRGLEVDLGRKVRGLGHHDDLVRANLDEASRDGEELLGAALPDPELSEPERREQRGMVRQDAEL